MTYEEAKETIDNMSEEELNEYIFFALKEMTKKYETAQAEIEKLRNNNKDLLRKLRNRVKKVKKLTRYSLYKKEFSTLNKQLEKKDKIIDEMAKYITSLDIEEDICTKTGRLGKCDSMAYGECEACIKDYFKKKVEDK